MVQFSPSPDCWLYLVPKFVDDDAVFLATKAKSQQIAAVKTIEKFALGLPLAIELDEYDAVVIWYEAFKQFNTVTMLEN